MEYIPAIKSRPIFFDCTTVPLMKTIVGGEIASYTDMLITARQIATKRMVDGATSLGADAIINVKYGSSAVMSGAAEIIAYGTAVKLKK